MAPPLTNDRQVYMLNSLVKLKEAREDGKPWTSRVRESLVDAATEAAKNWTVVEEGEVLNVNQDGRTLRYMKGQGVKYQQIMNMYQEPRRAGSMVASVWNEGNLQVCVGDFVLVKSPKKMKENYVLYVADLHSNGVAEAACSGYWVYTPGDVRKLPSGETFRAMHDREVLLSNHKAFVEITCVFEKVEVLPSVLASDKTRFVFHRYIKPDELCIRDIDFYLPEDPYRLLRVLAGGQLPRDASLLKRMLEVRLKGYVTGKQQPKSGRRSKIIMTLTMQDLFSLLPTIPENVIWKEGPIIAVMVNFSGEMEGVLGNSWEEIKVPARASQAGAGGEYLSYEFLFPCTIEINVHAPEKSCLLFRGLRLFNGAGVEQWDTTRQAPQKRNRLRPRSLTPPLSGEKRGRDVRYVGTGIECVQTAVHACFYCGNTDGYTRTYSVHSKLDTYFAGV
jgi:hypothetical protein